jgi:hypothetical protein
VFILGVAGSAYATPQCPGVGNDCSQDTINQGGSAAAAASATSTNLNTNLNTNTNINTQGQQQGQAQGQHQGQAQGQEQGQKQQANNEGNHQSVKFESPVQDRMPGLAVAPGLTAAGTGVCLGSVSIGLSGPMAGASFGITKVDKGCEQRSSAALLYQMGYKDAAVRLLMKNEDVREALGADAPRTAQAAPVDTTVPDLKLKTPLGEEKKSESTNFGERTSSLTIPQALVANLAAQSAGAGQ